MGDSNSPPASKQTEPPDMPSSEQEAAFFGTGGPYDNDYIDPELQRLAKRPAVLQLMLALLIMAAVGFIGNMFVPDLMYFFQDETPVELGVAHQNVAATLAADETALLLGSSNVYAHIEGIPIRRSTTGNSRFFQLQGVPIIVEETRTDDVVPRFEEFYVPNSPLSRRDALDHTYFEAYGRLISFAQSGRASQSLMTYYRDGYHIWFCNDDLSGELLEYRRFLKEEIALELESVLERAPTPEEVDSALDEAFHCEHGFLFQAGRAPSDHWTFLLLFVFLGLVELVSLLYCVRWVALMRTSFMPSSSR